MVTTTDSKAATIMVNLMQWFPVIKFYIFINSSWMSEHIYSTQQFFFFIKTVQASEAIIIISLHKMLPSVVELWLASGMYYIHGFYRQKLHFHRLLYFVSIHACIHFCIQMYFCASCYNISIFTCFFFFFFTLLPQGNLNSVGTRIRHLKASRKSPWKFFFLFFFLQTQFEITSYVAGLLLTAIFDWLITILVA